MLVKVDLHIHSALSACCAAENTVANVVNMSKILNTQIIALADHNSAGNVRAVSVFAEKQGILVAPAIEVTTAEEIHVLCLFNSVEGAEEFSGEIMRGLPRYPLNKKFYNPQVLFDCEDNKKGEMDFFLNVATKFDLYGLTEIMKEYGIAVPAHVDRDSYSLISVLGFVPEDLFAPTLEISSRCPTALREELGKKHNLIWGSDAHSLEQMCQNECYIDLPEVSVEALINKLKRC